MRHQGCALTHEEMSSGVEALAVPVTDATGKTVGGLAAIRVVAKFTEAELRQWVPMLRRAAGRISRLLVADWRDELVRPRGAV